MEIFRNVPKGFVRYTVTTYLTNDEVYNIVSILHNEYYNGLCVTLYDKLVDLPEASEWAKAINSYKNPEILELDEIKAREKRRCLECFNKQQCCDICKKYHNKAALKFREIKQLKKKQEKKECDFIEKTLGLRYTISFSNNSFYNCLDELEDYLNFDCYVFTFRIQPCKIHQFILQLKHMRSVYAKMLENLYDELNMIETKWINSTYC